MSLTPAQQALVRLPLAGSLFLEGPAGSGKTTVAIARLLRLLEEGQGGEGVLLFLPQRTLAAPYEAALRASEAVGRWVQPLTLGGLAQRMVRLFWPLVAQEAGFANPERLPIFLTLETAQYYLAHVLRPLLQEGLFEGVTVLPNRLYLQVLDNLNKAAVVGFPIEEIGPRLKAAWVGEASQRRLYDDVQVAVERFRRFCLEHNLLDFSLQVQVFREHLWPNETCRAYLQTTYRHLVYDNLEEDPPVAHDLIAEWLPHFASALLVYDWEAGYRRFLGADPTSAYALKAACGHSATLATPLVASPPIHHLAQRLGQVLKPASKPLRRDHTMLQENRELAAALTFEYHLFLPETLDWVTETIRALVYEEGLPPGEIAVLAPYFSDALRFALSERLHALGLPAYSLRPSRPLRDEPAAQCLYTLAALAHPQWGLLLTRFDVAAALTQAIEGMDWVRAQLLTEIVFRRRDGLPYLSPFADMRPEIEERITPSLGKRYEHLRSWLAQAAERGEALDFFLSRLFGEVLSQPGYGFHNNPLAARVAAMLIESIRKFRWASETLWDENHAPLGKRYLLFFQEGLPAAQYLPAWQEPPPGAVLLAPAYTFLMINRPVTVQFWLDAASHAWAERVYQPLAHPYVLSRAWPLGRPWNDTAEHNAEQEALFRLVHGLLRRCRRHLYLGVSKYNEQGFEQRGPLLAALMQVLQDAARTSTGEVR